MYNLTLSLDPASKTPMYDQLYRHFAGEIRAGRLTAGEKLPSKRALCAYLGVSRSTVETAYELLVSEGYIRAKPQSGYYVTDFVTFDDAAAAPRPRVTPSQPETPVRPAFDFSTASVDVSLFPYSSWAKLNREVVYAYPELRQRGERQGDLALRQALADFLSEYRGVSCVPEQIVVGAGMEYLTSVLLQLFHSRAVFGIEDPGYTTIFRTLRSFGRTVRFLPLDGDGVDVGALTDSDVNVAYITPSHQFPMGITMPAARRSQLLFWVTAGPDRYLIEDDYDSEFRYTSRPMPALQGMDTAGRVVYIGTFSRSIAPSIRIAYMVLPPALLNRYRSLPGHQLSTVSRYEQAVMARFLSEGYYVRYLRRVGNLYRRRRGLLTEALSEIEGVEIRGSGGGIHFLLTNPRWSEAELLSRAAARGIELRGLSAYTHRGRPLPSTLVVGYGGLRDEAIPRAVQELEAAWR